MQDNIFFNFNPNCYIDIAASFIKLDFKHCFVWREREVNATLLLAGEGMDHRPCQSILCNTRCFVHLSNA
jgi:hypothetical protein